jgi:hypothetical protein
MQLSETTNTKNESELADMKKLSKKDLNSNIYLSNGNLKLRSDAKNHFLIWNLPAIKTCLWRTALCEKFCYAKKAETLYRDVLPCREQNLEESYKDTFVKDMIDHIRWNISRKALAGKKVWFRIHESGDFYSLEYLKKWISIAEQFPGVTFLAYTKAVRLVAQLDYIPENFVIRYSVWEDTKQEELQLAYNLGMPIYTAFKKEELDRKIEQEEYTKCHCDCQKCKMCYTVRNMKLAVEIH